MRCGACGLSFRRAALLALLADSGATVSPGPNYCPDTEDHEHAWERPDEERVPAKRPDGWLDR